MRLTYINNKHNISFDNMKTYRYLIMFFQICIYSVATEWSNIRKSGNWWMHVTTPSNGKRRATVNWNLDMDGCTHYFIESQIVRPLPVLAEKKINLSSELFLQLISAPDFFKDIRLIWDAIFMDTDRDSLHYTNRASSVYPLLSMSLWHNHK